MLLLGGSSAVPKEQRLQWSKYWKWRMVNKWYQIDGWLTNGTKWVSQHLLALHNWKVSECQNLFVILLINYSKMKSLNWSNGYSLWRVMSAILSNSVTESPSGEASSSSVKKSSVFDGILWFTTVFMRAHYTYFFLSWARWSKLIPSHHVPWGSILLSSHLHLGLPRGLFLSSFPTTTLY